MSKTPWLDEALKCEGIKEIKGQRHNPKVVQFFAEAGHSYIDDDETAWCAAFMNAMLKRAGYTGTDSLAARSFMKYGTACEPKAGAIMVRKRGTSSWQGHVAICTGKTKRGYVECIGGNQRNAVNKQWYPLDDKLLGFRWPPTMSRSRTVKAQIGLIAAGGTATAVDIAEQVQPLAERFDSFQTIKYVATACAVILVAATIFYRWQDMKEKGR